LEQRACLHASNAVKPKKGATTEQRDAFHRAAAACGVAIGHKGGGSALTDEQRACLHASNAVKPSKGATVEQREAFRRAAAACVLQR